MIILGIETSCDDTAAAVVCGGTDIRSSVIASQTDYHRTYGGVVPEIASRKHQEHIIPVISEALHRASMTMDDVQGIAVTQGPGLVGSLLVGINVAKALAFARRLPLAGINHLEGHLLAPHMEHAIGFPHISLVVSGGHTNLYCVDAAATYRLLGRTRDDAAGEAFDKVAKVLNLGYPGGGIIDRLARTGNPAAIPFPRPMLHDDTLDFSFSGLKTAVFYHIKKNFPDAPAPPEAISDIAASFQAAVVDILVAKTLRAATRCGAVAVTVGGGVACNSLLRSAMCDAAKGLSLPVFIPSPQLCTDNAAMIACAGARRLPEARSFPYDMNARSRWPL